MNYSLTEINALPVEDFIQVVGGVFEHSPWVAERGAVRRPFLSLEVMHEVLCGVVREASVHDQSSLIRAHPDLVGRVVLTAESDQEQTAAGLKDLTQEEVALFGRYNREYKARFGFPFVICARLNKKEAILAAFPERLQNSPEEERDTALGEIDKIARLRLDDLIHE